MTAWQLVQPNEKAPPTPATAADLEPVGTGSGFSAGFQQGLYNATSMGEWLLKQNITQESASNYRRYIGDIPQTPEGNVDRAAMDANIRKAREKGALGAGEIFVSDEVEQEAIRRARLTNERAGVVAEQTGLSGSGGLLVGNIASSLFDPVNVAVAAATAGAGAYAGGASSLVRSATSTAARRIAGQAAVGTVAEGVIAAENADWQSRVTGDDVTYYDIAKQALTGGAAGGALQALGEGVAKVLTRRRSFTEAKQAQDYYNHLSQEPMPDMPASTAKAHRESLNESLTALQRGDTPKHKPENQQAVATASPAWQEEARLARSEGRPVPEPPAQTMQDMAGQWQGQVRVPEWAQAVPQADIEPLSIPEPQQVQGQPLERFDVETIQQLQQDVPQQALTDGTGNQPGALPLPLPDDAPALLKALDSIAPQWRKLPAEEVQQQLKQAAAQEKPYQVRKQQIEQYNAALPQAQRQYNDTFSQPIGRNEEPEAQQQRIQRFRDGARPEDLPTADRTAYEQAGLIRTQAPPLEHLQQEAETLIDAPEVTAAFEADYERIKTTMPDMRLTMEDGRTLSLDDLEAEFALDAQTVRELQNCALAAGIATAENAA